jgi:8-oxo-dGTP pyrophosphatase MutT (NUDIX family)
MTSRYTLPQLRRHFASAPLPEASVYGDDGSLDRASAHKPAAVLVPIIEREAGLSLLLTQRAPHLTLHSGQVSFPGGRADEGDAGPEATALREAHEEIGLDPARVELLGRLPEYRTGTGYLITPVVGVLNPPFELRPDPREVTEIFEVALEVLLDPANHLRESMQWQGRQRHFFVIPHDKHRIWGATAGMLVNLSRYLTQGRL